MEVNLPGREELGHEDGHEPLDRIDPVSRVVSPAPSESPRRSGHPVMPEPCRHRESQAEALRTAAVEVPDMVGGHQLDRLRSEDAGAIELAAVEEHLEETGVVVRRREEARAAGKTLPWSLDVEIIGGRFDKLEFSVLVGPVDRGETPDLALRQEKVRIGHAQRAGDPFFDIFGQAHAGHALDEVAEDIRIVTVDEPFSRLGVEREGGEPPDDVADRDVLVR